MRRAPRPSGDGLEGLDQLPPEIRALMMRQRRRTKTKPRRVVKRRRKPAILPPRGSHRNNPRNASAASPSAGPSQRMLSRLLGTVFRAIPSPSFGTSNRCKWFSSASGSTNRDAAWSDRSGASDPRRRLSNRPPRNRREEARRAPECAAKRTRIRMIEPRRLQMQNGLSPAAAPRISRREKPTPKPQSPPWVTVPSRRTSRDERGGCETKRR